MSKKLLSVKLKSVENKLKSTVLKGMRVFDQNDPYVNLEEVDFNFAYSFLSKKFFNKKSNWLKFKKYYLKLKPNKLESV